MEDLQKYIDEAQAALQDILSWWSEHSPDADNFGFYGSINDQNIADYSASKGLVLHSRILWTFSKVKEKGNENTEYAAIAQRAFDSLNKNFWDSEFGGMYWSLNPDGTPADSRKQIYGQAFAIYGLSAYYKAYQDSTALELAVSLYNLIEKYSFDQVHGGYFEAFARDWSEIDDKRLSDKDQNTAKSANTHLHILEAYAELYTVWTDPMLLKQISKLLGNFDQYWIHPTGHLQLFMDSEWNPQPDMRSFGHEIECAWLLYYCAEICGLNEWMKIYKPHSIKLAEASTDGWDIENGGLWYEYDPENSKWHLEKHWWPQAEAVVGYLHAYQLNGDSLFLDKSLQSWKFIQKELLVPDFGEWYWGKTAEGKIIPKEKAGFWKCPYHNARACMEFIVRMQSISNLYSVEKLKN
jgi:mannobiose 2-epimerase